MFQNLVVTGEIQIVSPSKYQPEDVAQRNDWENEPVEFVLAARQIMPKDNSEVFSDFTCTGIRKYLPVLKEGQFAAVVGQLVPSENGGPRMFDDGTFSFDVKVTAVRILGESAPEDRFDLVDFVAVGNVGNPPKTGSTKDGTKYAKLSLATKYRSFVGGKFEAETLWTRWTAWGQKAETAARYFPKGKGLVLHAIGLDTDLSSHGPSYYETGDGEKRSSISGSVNEFAFINDGKGKDSHAPTDQWGTGGGSVGFVHSDDDEGGEIPF